MNSQKKSTLETDDLIQAGAIILAHLGLVAENGQQEVISPTQRAHYRATKNWLTQYRPVDREGNLSRVRGFLEAFHHLCEVEAWEKATELLLLRIHSINQQLQGSLTDPLHLQLGRWGHYRTQIQLYLVRE
jgi:hypothetical protein